MLISRTPILPGDTEGGGDSIHIAIVKIIYFFSSILPTPFPLIGGEFMEANRMFHDIILLQINFLKLKNS